MDFKDGAKPQQTTKNYPFPVENQPPQLSIKIDDADIGFLYMKYYSMVYSRCLKILGKREAAQDAAHDVFEKIQQRKSEGKFQAENPPAYISRMARNMSINNKKRARMELIKIYDMAADGSINWFKDNWEQGQEIWQRGIEENGYDQDEADKIVKAILDEQDETTCKIYLYRYRDKLTLNQIGKVVGLGKSAVQKRIKNLENQVKVKLEKADL